MLTGCPGIEDKIDEIPVLKITLDKETVELKEGETVTLAATLLPEEAKDKTVTWTSEDESIATVDETGKITGVKKGQTTVKATAGYGSASVTVTVKEKSVPVTEITLSETALLLAPEEEKSVTVTVEPENATDKSVTWTSSDEEVATVDQTGKIKAVKQGEATITATCGTLTKTVSITVKEKLSSITITNTELSLEEEAELTLTCALNSENLSDVTLTWETDSTEVLTVDETGKVTALKEGKAKVKVTATQTYTEEVTISKSAEVEITVTPKPVPVTAITLSETDLLLAPEEEKSVTVTVEPENATDKSVTWSSSDEEVATVDQTGKIKAVKQGEATITAACGSLTKTVSVTVKEKLSSIRINCASVTLKEEGSYTLSYLLNSENLSDVTVIWSSDNGEVATVDENGKVTALKEGSAEVKVTASQVYSEEVTITKSATVVINVVAPSFKLKLPESTQSAVPKDLKITAVLEGDNLTITADEGYENYQWIICSMQQDCYLVTQENKLTLNLSDSIFSDLDYLYISAVALNMSDYSTFYLTDTPTVVSLKD